MNRPKINIVSNLPLTQKSHVGALNYTTQEWIRSLHEHVDFTVYNLGINIDFEDFDPTLNYTNVNLYDDKTFPFTNYSELRHEYFSDKYKELINNLTDLTIFVDWWCLKYVEPRDNFFLYSHYPEVFSYNNPEHSSIPQSTLDMLFEMTKRHHAAVQSEQNRVDLLNQYPDKSVIVLPIIPEKIPEHIKQSPDAEGLLIIADVVDDSPRKQPETFLRAAEHLDVPAKILSANKLWWIRKRHRMPYERKNLTDIVTLSGVEKYEYIAQAAAAFMPSTSESWGIGAYEAAMIIPTFTLNHAWTNMHPNVYVVDSYEQIDLSLPVRKNEGYRQQAIDDWLLTLKTINK